jgi:exosortase E/protease (VPEID-CTERM system)
MAAVAVLFGEYLLLSWAFDSTQLLRRIAWISGVEYLPPLAIAIGTAILFFASRNSLFPAPVAVVAPMGRRAWPYVAVHGVLFVAFLLLTRALFGDGFGLAGDPRAWFVAWALLGLAVIAALTLVVVPFRQFLWVMRQGRISILLGVLVGIVAWSAGRAAQHLWVLLGGVTIRAVTQVLSWIFTDSVYNPSRFLVGTSHFRVVVGKECSGFEGIGLMIVFAISGLVIFRGALRFPNALILLPLGVLAAWMANVLRIVGLIVIGIHWSPDLALGGFHSKAGWVLFCSVAFALMMVARRTRFFSQAVTRPEENADTWHPTAAYLTPLLAAIAVELVAGLFSIRLGFLYPIQGLAILVVLWAYRKCYTLGQPSWAWAAVVIGAAAFAVDLAVGHLPVPVHGTTSIPEKALGAHSIAGAAVLAAGLVRSVILVPVAEELAFRGYLLRRFISSDFTEVSPATFRFGSFLISSAAFGLLQSSWIAGTVAGMLYAFAVFRRGRLEDAFLAHAVTSLLAVLYSLVR